MLDEIFEFRPKELDECIVIEVSDFSAVSGIKPENVVNVPEAFLPSSIGDLFAVLLDRLRSVSSNYS